MTPEEFQSNLLVRPEVIGTPSALTHFLANTSSQRRLMFDNAAAQVEVIHGNETARFQTGFESKFGKYEFDDCERDQDIQVVKVIPKFGLSVSHDKIRSNPSFTVVYIGADDNKIGFFNINDYRELHSGFGYKNKKVTKTCPSDGDYISKDQKFTSAPNHDGPLYNMGLNANVCYMPMWDTTDDAFVISKSLAERFTHTVIARKEITIDLDTRPLNLYGDDTDYRCFPDIGNRVRDDGILIALRKLDGNSFLTDFANDELSIPRHMHDNLIMAPPGATIVDINVFINHKQIRKIEDTCYTQLLEYNQLHNSYYASVIDVFEDLTKKGFQCSPAFNNLVTRCKCFCYNRGGKSMILVDKKDVIENVKLELVYAYDQKISKGYKLSGSDGSKGVVSAIWEDEDMPVSIHGVRADIIITAESPFNRLNGGQFIEQFLSLVSEVVTNNVRNGVVPYSQAFEYILDYITDVQPNFAKLIRDELTTQQLKDDFVEAVKGDGIYMIIPPFCNSLSSDLYLKLSKKYNVDRGPITYYRRNPDGTREKIVTKCPGLIGAKYLLLLGKRPADTITASEFGYVNQFMSPMKPNRRWAKAQCLHGQTPQKYGEDEVANITAITGPMCSERIIGLYSNSSVAMDALAEKLLTAEHPSALGNIGMSTKDIVDTSSNIGLMKHMLCEIGYELKDLDISTMIQNTTSDQGEQNEN